MGTVMNTHDQFREMKIHSVEKPILVRGLGMAVFAVGLLSALSTFAVAETSKVVLADSVSIKIIMDDKTAEFELTAVSPDLSIAEVMKKVAEAEKEFSFKSRGRGDTFFVTEINGRKNEGARGRNWIFKVNGELGNKSAGSFKVKAGDKVEWNFQKYQPAP